MYRKEFEDFQYNLRIYKHVDNMWNYLNNLLNDILKERIFVLGSLKVGDKFKYNNNKVYMIVNMVKELTDIGDGCLVNKIQSYNCINIDRSSDILKIDKSNLNMMVEVVGI